MNTPPATLLLVDDDPNDVFLMMRAFERLGLPHAVHTVSDGEEALAYLSGEGRYFDRVRYPLPALVLLDLKVPRISGFEILTWLRRQPGLQRVPVVVLTSAAEAVEINSAYEHGANSYLVKPLGFERLVDLVRSIMHYWLTLNEPADLHQTVELAAPHDAALTP